MDLRVPLVTPKVALLMAWVAAVAVPKESCFALEVFVERLEELLPRFPRLFRLGLPLPCWAVVGEGVELK